MHAASAGELAVVAAVCFGHMSVPSFWLPYALVGLAQGWTLRRTLLVTLAGAAAHVCATLAAVLALAGVAGALLSHEGYRLLAAGVLGAAGARYLAGYALLGERGGTCCGPPAAPRPPGGRAGSGKSGLAGPDTPAGSEKSGKKSGPCENPAASGESKPAAARAAGDRAAALALVSVTGLSPCAGSMPVLLALLAPPAPAARVLAAGAALLAGTAGSMLPLVCCAYWGARRFDFERVRRHERLIVGLTLVGLALATFAMPDHHAGAHVVGDAAGAVARQGIPGIPGGGGGHHHHKGCH